MDVYEASVWDVSNTTQYGVASDNYPCSDNGNDCAHAIYARSVSGVKPSTRITWFQAQQACASSGKRLLTNAEWQMAAAGTPDDPAICNFNTTGVVPTGSKAGCVSNWGLYDTVGNAWEWVADWMQGNANNEWNPDRPSNTTTNALYGNDTMADINNAAGQGTGAGFPAALLRGGYYGDSGSGVFALLAINAPSEQGDGGITFRCAR
jgi:formylglycine-generating enzyme required for sulfatase activity